LTALGAIGYLKICHFRDRRIVGQEQEGLFYANIGRPTEEKAVQGDARSETRIGLTRLHCNRTAERIPEDAHASQIEVASE